VLQGRWAATTTSLLTVAAFASGCAGTSENAASSAPTGAETGAAALVSSAVVAMKQTRTAAADWKIAYSGGIVLRGSAGLNLDTGDKSVTWSGSGGPYTGTVKGQLIAAAGGTDYYWRETTDADVDHAAWQRPDPQQATRLDKPITPAFRAVSSAQLIDPLLLLDTGVTGAAGEVTESPDGRHISYEWNPQNPPAKEPMASFLTRNKALGDVSLDLTVDDAGHLTQAVVRVQGGSTTYDATIAYSDYGKPLAIDAPAGVPAPEASASSGS
jgi:hypothetical protein